MERILATNIYHAVGREDKENMGEDLEMNRQAAESRRTKTENTGGPGHSKKHSPAEFQGPDYTVLSLLENSSK